MGMNVETEDRVEEHTADAVNRRIAEATQGRLRTAALGAGDNLTKRIEDLDKEWDIERMLEMNASALAFTGLLLGMRANRKWLLVPALVLPFLFQHALQGWCPPLPILRRIGIRTRREIDAEKFALKTLRGDFDQAVAPGMGQADRAWNAVQQ